MKTTPLRWFSLAHAPDRGRTVGAVQLALASGLFLVGHGIAAVLPTVLRLPRDGALASLVVYLGMFGLPLALWLRLGLDAGGAPLGVRGRWNGWAARVALWGIPAGLVLVQAVNALGLKVWTWGGQPQPKAGHQVLEQLDKASPTDVALHALLAVVLAPVCEEAFFRGLLQTGAQTLAAGGRPVPAGLRWGVVVGVAVVFGIVHWGVVPPPLLPGLAAFGLLLGWAYERTGNFWVPVSIHAGFNAISFAVGLWQAQHPAGQ